MTALELGPSPVRRAVLSRRIRLFAAATITYNMIEAVVALWAGGVADSSALIGFGLDSVIEVASAVALSWQFSAKDPERREHLTLRLIAISFFALAAFVTFDSVTSLAGGGEAQQSTPGIIIAALSLAIMPVLSWLQRRAGRELGSRTAVADSKQTLLCTYLSAVLLIGLVLNSTLGWWWADAGAALVIAVIAVREGTNAWKGDVCCTVPHAAALTDGAPDDCCEITGPGKTTDHDGGPADPAPRDASAEDLVADEPSACCEGCASTPGPAAATLGPNLGRRNA
ncbi:cation diffusion facilitator family transporter [Arthrobacter sp. H-02-3]|uniref:cation diffusion facilitator family transporter n=1 Tax=Arthrobacter sp. H-02-3 TaxID=2703675 RepID=UPI000DD24D65|nr:cation transporter [Arthrobacter sp. H-02-3]PVZ60906.1 cation transporter [Arthrobacter sp. H-02-3]